ncbi:MAG TPA: hypothetical protein VN811_14730 [Thermoanaerobaculia bacterium]|nr:hypothetical protein [Thermoanaerobaculia bacterium]
MLLRQNRTRLALVALVAVAAYGALLRRGFTSEDFLLIRFLGEHPPWRDLAAQFSLPWLGISGIRFLRPLSTTLYALEIAVFGAHAVGYNVMHVLVHALNAVLVAAAVHELCGRSEAAARAALAGGVLFALHPLHPNAVIFSASFATLFGGAFVFAALFAYLRFRAQESRRWWALSLAAFVCGLLSYEAAAVLPLWLATVDHLAAARPQWRRLTAWLPFAGVLGLYLGWRYWVFGVFLGGYEATSQRLVASRPLALAAAVVKSVESLLLPGFDGAIGPLWLALGGALLVVGLTVGLLVRGDTRAARIWATGWIMLLTGLAPFAFEAMVPGNGRYGYFAAAGAVVAIAALFTVRPASSSHLVGVASWTAAAVIALVWGSLLAAHLRACAEAARTAQAVRQALSHDLGGGASGPSFVTGYPYFLIRDGVPVAQVFHYGLRDSLRPPFSPRVTDVLPLPPLAGDELLPVVRGSGPGRVWEWVAPGRLRAASPPLSRSLLELTVETSARGSGDTAALVRLPPGPYRRFRLLVSAPINGAVFAVPPPRPPANLLRVEVPREFVRTSEALYGPGNVYWWLEARDEAGSLTAFTRLRPLATPAQEAAVSTR